MGTTLIEYNVTSETREFSITLRYVFAEANVNEKALDHILRQISRVEALIHDNVTMTLSDANSTKAINCRFESTDLNTDEGSGAYITEWDWKCNYIGNIS